MSTTVVLASQGQLGSLILRQLRARGEEAVGVDLDICDLENNDSIEALFERFGGMERLFNAAAYTAVDAAEEQSRRAFRVNALGPGFLAAQCARRDIELIHFSTDYVFGEGHRRPISERATPEPLSVYGRSKWLGERMVREHHPRAYILRTCGLYSAHRPNFVRTMIRLGLSGRPIDVVGDQIMTPTRAASLATVAIEVAQRGVPGTYHATAQGACSWYQFARAIFQELGMTVPISPVNSSKWSAPAPRPSYSVLDNGLLRQRGLDIFAHWQDDLYDFLATHGDDLLKEAAQEIEPPPWRAAGT